MRLEIRSIEIREVRPSSRTCAEDHTLYVSLKELEENVLKDNRIKSVAVHLVYPGERVRILNLMDVVQPRCKIDDGDANFPGFVGKLQLAGKGRTRSLAGVGVLVSNPETHRKYSAFLDMSGLAGEMSRYSNLRHVSIAPTRAKGVEEREFEDAVKIAGFRTSVYLAQKADGHAVDEVEVYELDIPHLACVSGLPRVAYYCQAYSPQHDHLGISDPCFYGSDLRNMTPTVVHPNEVLDGGLVGHHSIRGLDTYTIQNHGVIKELYRRHGKDLIFAGMVCGAASVEPAARARQAMLAAGLLKNVLGAEGVVLTKVHGGMPHVDLGLTAVNCEKMGMRTAVFIQPGNSSGTLADQVIFASDEVDLMIAAGATMERVKIPLDAERFLGGGPDSAVYCPDPIVQRAGDEQVDVEEFLIAGIHDFMGGANIIAKEY